MSDDRETPTFASVLERAVSAGLYNVHVCIPGRVESYDASKRKISALPLIWRGHREEDGSRTGSRPAVIQEIPLIFPGSGGVRVKFPVSEGDVVLLLFSGHSLDRWLARGGEVDPEDDRRHQESDCIAIPGLQPFGGEGADGEAATYIEITDAKVDLGGGATEAAIKGNAYRSAEDTLLTAIGTFATAVGTALPAVSGAATTLNTAITNFTAAAASYLATKVKVV